MTKDRKSYDRRRDRARTQQATQAAAGQDCAPLMHPVVDPARRAACARNFRLFCETYMAEAFDKPWCDDHLKVIAKIERAVLGGGLFALAMPRGCGKTTICRAAVLWATLYGHRHYVCLIAAASERAIELLGYNKILLETGDPFDADFPEVTVPIRALGRTVNRQKGQKYLGAATYIEWTDGKVVLAEIPGSPTAGSIMTAAGMKGSHVRGQQHQHIDGRVLRPDLVIIDDPQTDDTACSIVEVRKRVRLLAGAVLGMAGPGKKIAAVLPCTVIQPGDVADQILDREKHPEWQGERMKFVYSWPTNEKRWDQYRQIYVEALHADGSIAPATEFYRKHRAEMDAGAAVAWESRFEPDEASALQNAMNLRFRDEEAFFAEYQNEPLLPASDAELLTADQIAKKVNGRRRGTAPTETAKVTAFIDVHDKVLFYAVCGWTADFTGAVLDYGTFPDQKRSQFTLRDARRFLSRTYPGKFKEESIRLGLEELARSLLAREWSRDDGAVLKIDLILIDRGYVRPVVETVCRRVGSPLMPSLGDAIRATNKPISQYQRRPGQTLGHHWWIPSPRGRGEMRHVRGDVNYWKSFVHARLAAGIADSGSLTFWGKKAAEHRLIADHLVAEVPQRVQARHTVDEWKGKPAHPDNHWFDCLVGCAVAASMAGVRLPGVTPLQRRSRRKKRRRITYLEGDRT